MASEWNDGSFLLICTPRRNAVACVEVRFLRLCTATVVRLHGSFYAVCRTLNDIADVRVPLGFKRELFHTWLVWMTYDLLMKDAMLSQDLRDIPVVFFTQFQTTILEVAARSRAFAAQKTFAALLS